MIKDTKRITHIKEKMKKIKNNEVVIKDKQVKKSKETKCKIALCDTHNKSGGSYNCLVCGMMELSSAFSKISYLLGETNEQLVSEYDVNPDPNLVVIKVVEKLDQMEKDVMYLREDYSTLSTTNALTKECFLEERVRAEKLEKRVQDLINENEFLKLENKSWFSKMINWF